LRNLVFPICLALAACGPYPNDVTGTLDDIERTRTIKIGFADMRPADVATANAFVARLEQATGAKAITGNGPTETQLARLENDQLDLVIGEFAKDSPWNTAVTILEPLGARAVGQHEMVLAPVAANGENRWIGLLEREIRDHAGGKM
jgi:hypothetical protein